LNNRIVDHQ